MIDKIFDLCVKLLVKIAELTGTTYKTVNVIIFCVLVPMAFILLFVMYYNKQKDVERYKKLYEKFVQDDIKNFWFTYTFLLIWLPEPKFVECGFRFLILLILFLEYFPTPFFVFQIKFCTFIDVTWRMSPHSFAWCRIEYKR